MVVYKPVFYVDGLLDAHSPLLDFFLQSPASFCLLV